MRLLNVHKLSMDASQTINIELIYIRPDIQHIIKLDVNKGATIESAIEQSGLLIRCPEIDLAVNKVGIFNHIQALDYVLNEGDRIEIYRPLQADPKEARRRRAKNTN